MGKYPSGGVMSESVNGNEIRENKRKAQNKLSSKANIISCISAAVCMIGGAAASSAGASGIFAVTALWAFASVACAMIFSFGSRAARALPAVCAVLSVLFGAGGVIFSALVIMCGVAIALSVSSRRRRFETVLLMALAVCVVFICVFAVSVRESEGSVGRDAVNSYISNAAQNVYDTYVAAAEGAREMLSAFGTLTPELEERLDKMSSPDMAGAVAKSFILSLPAYLAAAATVLCYGITSIFLMMAEKTGNKLYFMRPFSVPLVMAHTFIICYFATIFLSAQTVIGLVVYYVSVVFTPCFAYVGAKSIIAMLRSGAPAFIRVAAVVFCIVMLPMISYLITLLAFIGAYVIVRAAALARIVKNSRK